MTEQKNIRQETKEEAFVALQAAIAKQVEETWPKVQQLIEEICAEYKAFVLEHEREGNPKRVFQTEGLYSGTKNQIFLKIRETGLPARWKERDIEISWFD